jgi:hypothetical protein
MLILMAAQSKVNKNKAQRGETIVSLLKIGEKGKK